MPEAKHPREEERGPQHPLPYTRRRFLRGSAMAVAGGVLFSCTGRSVVPRLDDPTPEIDTATPIKRVVYVMLENRSFNNLFGKFPGVEGTTVGVEYGKEKPLIRCPEWLPGDLPHDRAAHLTCVDGGKMDGFGNGEFGSEYAYSMFDEDQIPNYWTWAREYALSDHFFSSMAGPSYPNHFYFIAGQSGGVLDNPENIETRVQGGGRFKSWGCDALGDDVFVFTKDDRGNLTKHDTCFNYRTVGQQLNDVGVDWTYYSASRGQVGYFWNAYNGIGDVFHDPDMWTEHMRAVDRIVPDIEAGRLPAVTWVTPRFELSDHPPYSTGHAHNWLSEIVNAVMRSPMWEHTAIFVTWDEWGGFYDPVLPPTVDDLGLGVRVPLLTISPYTERGVIDTEIGEFSTPLRFISDNWGLPYLTPRIEKTHAFDHVFDFKQRPREPAFGRAVAPTYGGAFGFPDGYDGWQPGTDPNEEHFIT